VSEFIPLGLAVLTVSDTRRAATDGSGDLLAARLAAAGHRLAARDLVADERAAITGALEAWLADPEIAAILITGGTGITARDVTPEAVTALLDKPIPGFGELFRWLSYESIGAATIQSRALAGVARGRLIFALPGSPNACREAWDRILASQLDARTKPCNFVELLPRLDDGRAG